MHGLLISLDRISDSTHTAGTFKRKEVLRANKKKNEKPLNRSTIYLSLFNSKVITGNTFLLVKSRSTREKESKPYDHTRVRRKFGKYAVPASPVNLVYIV